jgi:two-component system, OmpR family, sensor histidine kinase ResE
MMENLQAYWKQFVASATDYARKYQTDVFLKTEVNIIGLHVAYACLILLFSVGSIFFVSRERIESVLMLVVVIVGATILFGYLVAKRALTPARTALTAQKEFIGNIAHELRTPLAIIKANTEILLMERRGDQHTRESLESSIEELNRISEIINNLLTLNVLVQPEQMTFEEVDFGTIIRRVVATSARPPRDKAIRLKVRVGADCLVLGNAAALEQIATNLIKNALEHTNSGEITLTAECRDDQIFEFSVRDTGTGIKQADLFRIFEPFYRGDRARTRSGSVGSGLGLTIVSELIKLHKGRISIKSTPGHGTTVTVLLPQGFKPSSEKAPLAEQASEVFADFWSGKRK